MAVARNPYATCLCRDQAAAICTLHPAPPRAAAGPRHGAVWMDTAMHSMGSWTFHETGGTSLWTGAGGGGWSAGAASSVEF